MSKVEGAPSNGLGSDQNSDSEAQILSEVVSWSTSCPEWQRDALRRLCDKTKLDQADLNSLLAICKGKQEGSPIGAEHVRDPSASKLDVSLAKLHSLQHVNALQPGEALTFQKTGITVVYGDNGAGKSGYARVLKQACRARLPKNDSILPSIYSQLGGTPQAEIDFRVGQQKQSIVWRQGAIADPRLSAVSVFDSNTATVHVDAKNDLAYTPLPLRMLAALADACKSIRETLSAEIKTIEQRTPAILKSPECSQNSAVGQLLAGLSHETSDEQVTGLAGLSENEEARLKSLTADLANDPSKVAKQLQAQKSEIVKARQHLLRLANAVSEESISNLKQSYESYTLAKAAAALVSDDLFSNEPLPQVGSDVWRSLWEAAREYSSQAAYSDQPFPVTEPESRCVLCHQTLGAEASDRLNRFESFVLDESKIREDKAFAVYKVARSELEAAHLSIQEINSVVYLIQHELEEESLAAEIRRCAVQNSWRLRKILRAIEVNEVAIKVPLAELPEESIDACVRGIEKRAAGFSSESESSERKALISERVELADRKWLAMVKADVLGEMLRLKSINELVQAKKLTTTNKTSTLSTELAKRLVTKKLRNRFAQEVAELGVAEQHSIELEHHRSPAGVPLFHVRLGGEPNRPVGKILSEGEYRCVALAAFMSELSTSETSSGIVFDDPVSSLDHIHRDRVAERLAKESLKRQVVVFTHDVAFLVLLEEACRATSARSSLPIAYRVISRGADAAGFCNSEPPANVLPVDKVVAQLRKHLSNVKIHHERGNQKEWRREVGSFSQQLREAWERAVEEVVSPVIKRLAQKVQTEGLLRLTVLREQDCRDMRDAFGRCSKLIHSQPGDINPRLPAPSDIETEISILESWTRNIRNRQDQLR